MSTLRKLKAYFGMVPADELDDYDEERYGEYEPGYHAEYQSSSSGDDYDPRDRRRPMNTVRQSRSDPNEEYAGFDRDPRRRSGRPWASESPRMATPVRGALAMEPEPEPSPRVRSSPEAGAHPLSKITTLHPRSYMEARTIGERYRDGIPVIMNLTEMDDADAKRLVDFAAGLAFALRGSMDKVTSKVFLISPPDVDVTAEDRRRIAEGGLFS